MTPLEIAQLLQILLPLGADLYNKIKNANTGANLPSVADILANTDKGWDEVIAAANAELAKTLPPPVVQHVTVGDPVDLALQPGSLTPSVVKAALVVGRASETAASDTPPQRPVPVPEPTVVTAAKSVAAATAASGQAPTDSPLVAAANRLAASMKGK